MAQSLGDETSLRLKAAPMWPPVRRLAPQLYSALVPTHPPSVTGADQSEYLLPEPTRGLCYFIFLLTEGLLKPPCCCCCCC